MKLVEELRDLFSVDKEYALVHCISADFAMGAGIAKEFNRRGVKDFIMKNYTSMQKPLQVIGLSVKTYATDWLCEYNLVTKHKYWQKPSYKNLEAALIYMRESIKQDNIVYEEMLMEYGETVDTKAMRLNPVRKLAMPRIGCGLDKLEWSKVRKIIENVFAETDLEILVCYQ